MDHPNVRQAQKTDQTALGDLWMQFLAAQAESEERIGVSEDARERWENDFPVRLDDDTSRLYVAEAEDGTLVGFAGARRWGPAPIYAESSEVYLDEIYVHPEHRRQGYGTQLVAAVRTWADRVGAHRIRLRVLTSNADGRAFWAAQDAIPLSMTLTIEDVSAQPASPDEGTKKIGFQSERTS